MHIRTVGVLGCGLMGSGIAQVCAAAGYNTIVREVDEAFLQKGLGRIRRFLEDGITRGKVTPDTRDAMLARLSGTTNIEAMNECDLIIEAIVENLEAKRATYAALTVCHSSPGDAASTVFPSPRSSPVKQRCHPAASRDALPSSAIVTVSSSNVPSPAGDNSKRSWSSPHIISNREGGSISQRTRPFGRKSREVFAHVQQSQRCGVRRT